MRSGRSSTLSVCCLVHEPPERVAGVLSALRPVADELVVAVDSKSPAAESTLLPALADHFYRVLVQSPFEQYLPWLHSLCSGDWIFRIDGDETPGAALLGALPSLVADDRVLQYRLPRRWLFPGAGDYLASAPWYPDYQVRLVRNDPATLRFRGTLHSSAEPILPARYVAEPIYHLALLGSSFEDREARVQRYGAEPFAVPNVDNAGFYLPELRGDAMLEPVPESDRELIERALTGVTDVEGEPAAVRDVTLAEALRLSPIREIGLEAHDIELECLEPELRFLAGSAHEVPVRIRNRGRETFRWGDWSPAIRPSYHWLTPSGDPVVWDGHRTLLSHDLGPGGETIVPLAVVAPPEPGEYLLEIDLVHEGVRWFGCGLRVPVTVKRPADRGAAEPVQLQGRVVCVLGMHRSGTSAVAQLLNLLGVHLGKPGELLEPAADNRAGYWEHRDVVALNDAVLAAMGGSAVAPPPLPDGWEQSPELDALQARAAAVVDQLRNGYSVVGWKDPRTSLTLPFWRRVAPVSSTVLAIRHPLEVGRSLAARNGISEEAAARLYVRYVVAAVRNDPGGAIVRYDDLFDELDGTVERLAGELGLDPPDAEALQRMRKSIDPALRHAHLGTLEADGAASVAAAVYRLLADERKDAVLALSAPLLDWSSGAVGELPHELAETATRLAAVEAELASLKGRRVVRLGFGLAESAASIRRRLRG